MAAINLQLSFFTEVDGNAMSINERISHAIQLLEISDDHLEIDNEHICNNEEELRNFLLRRGIL